MRGVTRRSTPLQFICYIVTGRGIQRNARVGQRWTNPGRQFVWATKFSAAAPNICGSAVCSFWRLELRRGGSRVFLRPWVRIVYTPGEKRTVSSQNTSVQPTLRRYKGTNGYKKRKRSAMSNCGGSLPFLTKRTGKLVLRYHFYSFLERFDFRSSSGTGNKCLFCVDDFSSLVVLTMTRLFCGQNKTGLE